MAGEDDWLAQEGGEQDLVFPERRHFPPRHDGESAAEHLGLVESKRGGQLQIQIVPHEQCRRAQGGLVAKLEQSGQHASGQRAMGRFHHSLELDAVVLGETFHPAHGLGRNGLEIGLLIRHQHLVRGVVVTVDQD